MPDRITFPIRSDKLAFVAQVESVLLERRSNFQKIEILETPMFGKVLLLDGHIQLTELDEHVYHEALVQVPLVNLRQPTSALVVGGGDGGVIRELCRCPSLATIDMVEIDAEVVRASREVWPELSAGAFDDPRVRLYIADAFGFVKSTDGPYDLVVVDSTDVYEDDDESLSAMLFTDEFYRDLRRLLRPAGFVVTQADNLVFCPYSLNQILAMFGRVFPKYGSYFAVVPSFGGYSGYAWASVGAEISPVWPEAAYGSDFRFLNPTSYNFGMSGRPLGSGATVPAP
ncbi:MAG: polyamine aminopropyltransferase [Fimbriimonadaceae bacterium]